MSQSDTVYIPIAFPEASTRERDPKGDTVNSAMTTRVIFFSELQTLKPSET